MTKVHILPPEIISKIAAGEVIDRPASVIKELIENSLDAGSDSIELHLTQAGKTSICIKDTGSGIAEKDIETIFHRHATSKIKKIDDLFNIHSLGFRGEALYSVAAIADVTLRSRTQEQDSGWEIHMRGGKKLDLRPTALPTGTEIEVKELFFNTPARRKFLKSNTSEMNQVLNIFVPYCLLYPERRFLLTHQNKTTLDLKTTADLKTRVAETLNLDTDHILEAQQNFTDQNIAVKMLLGNINITRSRRDMQFIFINGRPVQSKNISFHLNNVFRLIFPQGVYPFFALYITLPAGDVDVNIHPTKREVKIHNEQNLCSILRHMAERVLMSRGQAKEVVPLEEGPEIQAIPSPIPKALSKSTSPAGQQETIAWDDEIPVTSAPANEHAPTEQYAFPQPSPSLSFDDMLLEKNQINMQSKLARARYIGSFINKYQLFEVEDTLLLVDQHAAQERITFEHLIEQMQKGKIEVQHLLSPYLVKLSPQDLLLWEEAKDRLEQTGLASTQFDDETIAVHTYPVLIKDPEHAVREILAGGNVARCDHETIARRACRSSIMTGDKLTIEQVEFQRKSLIQCQDPFTCPHGRPTVIELKENFLDKQFLRT